MELQGIVNQWLFIYDTILYFHWVISLCFANHHLVYIFGLIILSLLNMNNQMEACNAKWNNYIQWNINESYPTMPCIAPNREFNKKWKILTLTASVHWTTSLQSWISNLNHSPGSLFRQICLWYASPSSSSWGSCLFTLSHDPEINTFWLSN